MSSQFSCRRCGWGCRSVNINVAYSDVLRWAKEKRYDILATIAYIDHDDPNKRGFYIEDTVTAPKKPCPFLIDGDTTSCGIHETKPIACRNFPIAHTDEKRAKLECPALSDARIDQQESHDLRRDQAMDFIIADDRKEQLLRIIADARDILALQERIKVFGDDPTESLYATGFTNNRTGWTRVGTTPWLSAQDQPTNYVWTATKKAEIGDWSFADTARPYTDTLNSVTLYVYAQTVVGSSDCTLYIWDGSSWNAAGITLQTSWGWASVDISSILDSWTKVDGAEMYIEHANTTNRSDVDAAYLLIDYTEGLTQVGKNLQALWDIDNLAGRSLQAVYDMLNLAGRSLQADWDILDLAGRSLQVDYDILNLAGRSIQAVWDMEGVVGKNLQALWDIRNLAGRDVQAIWDLFNLVGRDLQADYDILNLAGRDLQAIWDVGGLVGKDLEMLWDILSGGVQRSGRVTYIISKELEEWLRSRNAVSTKSKQ